MKKILFSVLLALSLVACTNTPPAPPPFTISFADKPAYTLAVGKIDIVEEYKSSFKYPNVEHLFTVNPAESVRIWARDRLREGGGENFAEIVILDASVIEKPLPLNKGIKGAFTNEQAESYDANLAVEVKIFKPGKAIPSAKISVNVSKSTTVAENATVADREKLFNDIITDMAKSLDAQLEQNIGSYLNNYILQ